jgi:hypothetical protein
MSDEAARLAEALAQVPGLVGAGVMTIDDGQLTLRLTRGAFRLGASREAVPP